MKFSAKFVGCLICLVFVGGNFLHGNLDFVFNNQSIM